MECFFARTTRTATLPLVKFAPPTTKDKSSPPAPFRRRPVQPKVRRSRAARTGRDQSNRLLAKAGKDDSARQPRKANTRVPARSPSRPRQSARLAQRKLCELE